MGSESLVQTGCGRHQATRAVTSAIYFLVLFSVTSQLDIRRPPSIVVSPIERKIYSINVGGPLQLDCVASGSPKPEYSWYKDGRTLSGYGGHIQQVEEGTIAITLSTMDEGYYQCFATNMYGTALSNMVVLQRAVLAPYAGKNVFETGVLTEGQPYTLPCAVTKYFPKPTFSWAIVKGVDDDTESPINLDKRIQMDESGNLHFSYVVTGDAQDGKLYKCKLFNPILDVTYGGSYARMQVKSIGGVTPFGLTTKFSSNPNVLGLETRNISLRCFFSGSPEPAITWTRNTGQLPIRRTVISNFGTELTILNLTLADAALYTCTAQNTKNTTFINMAVTIEAAPVFRSYNDRPQDINATEGDTIDLYCRTHAVPEATVVWMRNGVPLDPANLPRKFRLSDNGIKLTIRDLCKECEEGTFDLAVIQCNASNVHGSAFADGYVNVLKRTVMNVKPEDFTLEADKELALFSFMAESDDSTPVMMEWSRVWDENSREQMVTMGDVVRVGREGNIATLQFNLPTNSTTRASYTGQYKATAWTKYSQAEASVVFTVLMMEKDDTTEEPVIVGVGSLADYWWIFLLIALLILLLILCLCCCICLQRNKGETYPVYNEERKSKNDPDKDIEDSGFHEYSRPEGQPVNNPAALLGKINDDSDGSQDDDISLDYGHEDTGKYTEDGSFIGDYAEENRRAGRASDNRPSTYSYA